MGFECLKKLMDDYRPKYMVDGHVHMNYGVNRERVCSYGSTTIINAYEKYEFDF